MEKLKNPDSANVFKDESETLKNSIDSIIDRNNKYRSGTPEEQTEIRSKLHHKETKSEICFDFDLLRYISEGKISNNFSIKLNPITENLNIYPDDIIEKLKSFNIDRIREVLKTNGHLVYNENSIKIYAIPDATPYLDKLEQNIVEFDFLVKKIIKSERFGNIDIDIDGYFDKNINFFQKLDEAGTVQILVGNPVTSSLIMVDDIITSIFTFIDAFDVKGLEISESVEQKVPEIGKDLFFTIEAILKKYNISFTYDYRKD